MGEELERRLRGLRRAPHEATIDEAAETLKRYREALEVIHELSLDPHISLKAHEALSK